MTPITITAAITAVEIVERIIAGGTPIPRNQSVKEKLRDDLNGTLEILRQLKAHRDDVQRGLPV